MDKLIIIGDIAAILGIIICIYGSLYLRKKSKEIDDAKKQP